MRVFFDFEFIEGGSAFVMEPISLGMAREDGEELYYEWPNVDWSKANQWVLDNVRPYLHKSITVPVIDGLVFDEISDAIIAFYGEKPELWAYYADYDWVLLCQLFGKMIDLPEGWPMWCRDLKQYIWHYGIKKERPHHALEDAIWNRDVFNGIQDTNHSFPMNVINP